MPQYSDNITLPYSKEQLFDLVIDIEKYPEFLPWCSDARILNTESDNIFYAELEIKFKAFFHRYTSKVKVNEIKNIKEHFLEIDVTMVNGPFRKLINKWKFEDNKDQDGTLVSFFIDLELKSIFFNKILNMVFDHAYKKMLISFKDRANKIYGTER